MTSRDPHWSGISVTDRLPALPIADAAAFLRSRLGSDDDEAARDVARILDGLPLALEQACAYSERTHRSLAQYRDLVRRKLTEVLARGEGQDYPATVASTWELSFQALERDQPVAVALLQCVAWLSPDRIALALFRHLADHLPAVLRDAVEDELAFDDALAELGRYSLVQVSDDALSLHRLVQVITRSRTDPAARTCWAAAAVRLLEAAFDLRNGLPLNEWSELHTHVRSAVDAVPVEPVAAAGLLYRLAVKHQHRDVEVAVTAMRDALSVLTDNGWAGSDVAALTEVALGQLYCEVGDFDAGRQHLMAATERGPVMGDVPEPFAGIQHAAGVADRRWLRVERRGRVGGDAAEISVDLAPDLHRALGDDEDGPLVRQLRGVRWRLWQEFGVPLPTIMPRLATLPERTYLVRVDQVPVVGMRLPLDARFVPEQRDLLLAAGVPFEPTINPLNGLPAAWVEDRHHDALQAAGISSDPPSFALSLHVQAVLWWRLGAFLSHQDVADLLYIHLPDEQAARSAEDLLTPLTSVLRGLLDEQVPVRSLPMIVERVRTAVKAERSLVSTVDEIRCSNEVRFALPGSSWRHRYLRLTPDAEAMLADCLRETGGEPVLVIGPTERTQSLLAAVRTEVEAIGADAGPVAVLVREPRIRVHLRRIVEVEHPHVPVVADREIGDSQVDERVVGTIAVSGAGR